MRSQHQHDARGPRPSCAARIGCLFLLLVAWRPPSSGDGHEATLAEPSEASRLDRALDRLRSYRELRSELELIGLLSPRVRVGPLVRNGQKDGLIDIDKPVEAFVPSAAAICGEGAAPSVRQAVTCTLGTSQRGNTDPQKIGFSTQGREILAARLGRRGGDRVVFITQQHGNEVAPTEAAMAMIRKLAFSPAPWVRRALRRLDILFILRANPDGSEPSPGCALSPFPTGQIYPETCAITRWNVDKSAGGGFAGDTESGFFGVVGQGYDLNRYHYPQLDAPIRPVETQAMVAALLVFEPKYIVDMHGDIIKTTCAIDLSSVVVDPGLGLPLARCLTAPNDTLLGPSPVQNVVSYSTASFSYPPGSPQQTISRALASGMARAVGQLGLGPVVRFTQPAIGSGAVAGDPSSYRSIGALPIVSESRNFAPEVLALGVSAVQGGLPQVGINNDSVFDPGYLEEGIRINRTALGAALRTMSAMAVRAPASDGGYCALPKATGAILTLPAAFFGPNPFATTPIALPLDLIPTLAFDDCP